MELLHLLWAVQLHVCNQPVYNNHPREAAASTRQAIIFGRIIIPLDCVPWLLRSTTELMQLSHLWSGTDVTAV